MFRIFQASRRSSLQGAGDESNIVTPTRAKASTSAATHERRPETAQPVSKANIAAKAGTSNSRSGTTGRERLVPAYQSNPFTSYRANRPAFENPGKNDVVFMQGPNHVGRKSVRTDSDFSCKLPTH